MTPYFLTIFVAFLAIFNFASASSVSACGNNGTAPFCACTNITGVVTYVDCTGRDLSVLPDDIPATITILRLQSNSFVSIPSMTFMNFTSLQELYLQNNNIFSVSSGAFAGLVSLQILSLSGNLLSSLPMGIFDPMLALTTLLLSNNALTSLSTQLQSLPLLTSVSLDGNKLTAESIDPNAFVDCRHLTSLDLHGNRLTTITYAHLSTLTSLTSLNLADNTITTLSPAVFSTLSALSSLDLSSNFLTSLSPGLLSNHSALTQLWLQVNMLTSVTSNDIPSTLTSLSIIRLDSNSLKTVNMSLFTSLPALQQVFLGGTNNWDCCGLEWIRTFSVVQDATNMLCAQPQNVAGTFLSATTGSITVCSPYLPDAPPAPTVVETATTEYTLTMSWGVTAGNAFAVDYYILEYIGLDDVTPTWSTVQCDNTGNGIISDCDVQSTSLVGLPVSPLVQTATGLFPYSRYIFRVRAHSPLNGGSFGPASQNSSIVVTGESYAAIVSNLSVSSITSRTASLQWLAPARPRGNITLYVANVYLVTPNVPGSNTLWLTVPLPLTGPYTFTTLTPRYQYLVSISAFTLKGSGGPSANVSFQTLEDVPNPPSPPLLVTATSTSLVVNWSAPAFVDSNGVIRGYTVAIVSPSSAIQNISVDNNTFMANFSSLLPSQQYGFVLYAATMIGNSNQSAVVFYTCSNAAPSSPNAPTYTSVTATSVVVHWLEPTPPNGVILKYELYIQHGSSLAALQQQYGGSIRQDTITSLNPATTYSFFITAYTSSGSTMGATSSVTTLPAAPGSVPTPWFSNVTSTSVVVHWNPPAVLNGVILDYQVFITSAQQNLPLYPFLSWTIASPVATTPLLQATITNLLPAVNYTFSVAGVTAGGVSSLAYHNTTLTLESVPSQIVNVSVEVLGAGVVALQWQQPETPNGIITAYNVYANRDSNPTPILVLPPAIDFNVTVTGLASDTLYGFTVVAVNSAGESPQSNALYDRTLNTSIQFSQIMIIIGVCVFAVIIAIGFVYERRRRQNARVIAQEEEMDRALAIPDSQKVEAQPAPSPVPQDTNADIVAEAVPPPIENIDSVPRAALGPPKQHNEDASSTSSHPIARVPGTRPLPNLRAHKPPTKLPAVSRPPVTRQRDDSSDSD